MLCADFRDTTGADWVTLPQAFKNAGYVTAGAGKLFHPGGPSGYLEKVVDGVRTVVRSGDDYPYSWTLPYQQNLDMGVTDAAYPNDAHPRYTGHGYARGNASWSNLGIDAPIDEFNDARNAMSMVETIRLLSNSTMAAPFFIAQGFHRPHIPYLHPKEFAQYYPNDTVKYPPDGFGEHALVKVDFAR